MNEAELRAKCRELRRELDSAPRDTQTELAIEQNLDHFEQRLANVQAGHGDTASLTGAKADTGPSVKPLGLGWIAFDEHGKCLGVFKGKLAAEAAAADSVPVSPEAELFSKEPADMTDAEWREANAIINAELEVGRDR